MEFNMLLQWKTYKGRRIIYLDCRGLKPEELLQILQDAADTMKTLPNKVPVLANVQGVILSTEFMGNFLIFLINFTFASTDLGIAHNLRVNEYSSALVLLDLSVLEIITTSPNARESVSISIS